MLDLLRKANLQFYLPVTLSNFTKNPVFHVLDHAVYLFINNI